MIVKNVNPNQLLDELIEMGINSEYIFITSDIQLGEYIAENTEITFGENVDRELIEQVIENHNPTPPPKAITPEERMKALEKENERLNKENEKLLTEDLNNKEALAELYLITLGGGI